MSGPKDRRTRAVRAGVAEDPAFGAVMPPIVLSTNFAFEGLGRKRRYDYTRSGNPTRDGLVQALADLEGATGGVATASGLAAVTLVLHLLEPGDLVVAPHDGYGGTFRLMKALAAKGLFRWRLVDETDPREVLRALDLGPAMLWIETPSNPCLRITDVAHAARAAKKTGTLVVADNTFLTPLLQRPLELGADVVVHSTTKYLNGHSDVVGGAALAKDPGIVEKLQWWGNALGLTGSPFDSFLTLRGVRTLDARMRIHEENARAVAGFLARHPAVARVHYPGLASDPGHALARRQQSGFGGMLSFEVRGGLEGARAFLDGLRWFTLAESLGGVESLVAHPATMTHASMDPAAREAAGIGDGLVRLSVGIEAVEDLIADLGEGLVRATAAAARAGAAAHARPARAGERLETARDVMGHSGLVRTESPTETNR